MDAGGEMCLVVSGHVLCLIMFVHHNRPTAVECLATASYPSLSRSILLYIQKQCVSLGSYGPPPLHTNIPCKGEAHVQNQNKWFSSSSSLPSKTRQNKQPSSPRRCTPSPPLPHVNYPTTTHTGNVSSEGQLDAPSLRHILLQCLAGSAHKHPHIYTYMRN